MSLPVPVEGGAFMPDESRPGSYLFEVAKPPDTGREADGVEVPVSSEPVTPTDSPPTVSRTVPDDSPTAPSQVSDPWPTDTPPTDLRGLRDHLDAYSVRSSWGLSPNPVTDRTDAVVIAGMDPPWTEAREPYCRRCTVAWTEGKRPHSDGCGEPHYAVVDLVRCRATDLGLVPTSWITCTDLWWEIRGSWPEILWRTNVHDLGMRLAREGWRTRWRGSHKAYFLSDLPGPGTRTGTARKRASRRRR